MTMLIRSLHRPYFQLALQTYCVGNLYHQNNPTQPTVLINLSFLANAFSTFATQADSTRTILHSNPQNRIINYQLLKIKDKNLNLMF